MHSPRPALAAFVCAVAAAAPIEMRAAERPPSGLVGSWIPVSGGTDGLPPAMLVFAADGRFASVEMGTGQGKPARSLPVTRVLEIVGVANGRWRSDEASGAIILEVEEAGGPARIVMWYDGEVLRPITGASAPPMLFRDAWRRAEHAATGPRGPRAPVPADTRR